MTKQEFLARLRRGLSGLPQHDIDENLAFYSEMIDDRMEEGLLEEEAVSAIGSADEIIAQAIADIPLLKIAKERIRTKSRLKAWEIVLIILGFPIWLSLGVAVATIILSLYVSLWAVIISLWAVFGSMVGCLFGSMVAGVVFVCIGNILTGVAMIAAGIVCAGLSIFMFCGCKTATKGIVILTKKLVIRIKNCFVKKEEV